MSDRVILAAEVDLEKNELLHYAKVVHAKGQSLLLILARTDESWPLLNGINLVIFEVNFCVLNSSIHWLAEVFVLDFFGLLRKVLVVFHHGTQVVLNQSESACGKSIIDLSVNAIGGVYFKQDSVSIKTLHLKVWQL